MSAQPDTADASCDTRATTLGDLLYANPTKAHIPETDWVALIRSIAAGEELALRELYERIHPIVFTLALRIIDNRETAQELTVEVFHEIWRRAATYNPMGGSVIGWIMNQTRSTAIHRLRFEKRMRCIDTHPERPLAEAAACGSTGIVDRSDRARVLQEALAALTSEERTIIHTTFFSGLTYVEAAAHLNQPVEIVKTRICSALGKLRQALVQGANDL